MRFAPLISAVVTLSLLILSPTSVTFISGHGDHSHDHSHESTGDTAVVPLNAENFSDEVTAHPLALVEFFAPWCGHCKALAPQYATASVALKDDALLGAVDCTVEKDLCSQYGVKGFPTLKVFRGDPQKPTDYAGGRQADDIIKYMKKQNEPSYVEIKSTSDFNTFIAKDGADVVFFGDDSQDDAFLSVANELRNDYNFAVSRDTSVARELTGAVTAPAVYLFKSEGGATEAVKFEGELTEDNLDDFIAREAFPIVGEIGPENFQKYLDRGLPLIWFFYNKDDENHEEDLKELTRAATNFKGQVSVVKLDGHRWAEHAKHFGVPAGHLPAIVAEDRDAGKNYVFPVDAEVNEANLRAHLQGFVDGSLHATLKSQEPPATQDGPVTVVVGKTFDSIVMDDSKDVMVEFYAPWCGHCKNLAPKYDQLGETMKEFPNVVIAKVDATENDTPAKIEGFPTLIFYPAGSKSKPISYDGDRTAEAIEAFIKENGSTFKGTKGSHEEL